MREKVEVALQDIRPALQADGGDVELVHIIDGDGVALRGRSAVGRSGGEVLALSYEL